MEYRELADRIDSHLETDDSDERHWSCDDLLLEALEMIIKLGTAASAESKIRSEICELELEIRELKKALSKANASNSKLAQKNHELTVKLA